jgi:hypothetical protein
MKSMDRKTMVFLLPLALFVAGCSNHAETPVLKAAQPAAVSAGTLVPVRISGVAAEREELLVPASAVFQHGELSGVLIVGADSRISQRWIRPGRKVNGDIVVLGGVDKGELVVETYNPELGDGVTVIKSPNVTEEVQNK